VSTRRFVAMGCTVEVGGATADELAAVELLFRGRDRQFSRFREGSELNRVNRAPTDVVVTSAGFAEMLARGLRAAEQTEGLVDPTLGEAIVSAGYDRDFDELEPREEPARPGATGRWRSIQVAGRLLSRPVGLRLDLNGVVKGQTVDDALALIGAEGFVSAGGDYAGRGSRAVALPQGGAVQVTQGALATSGRSTRRWLRAGVWQHHLIDPRTGSPAVTPWDEVTVSAATCLQADIAAKAAFVLGDDGPEWLDGRGLAGRFLRKDGEAFLNAAWQRVVPTDAAAA
jgi:thiamine biosynthesis lipoprotein